MLRWDFGFVVDYSCGFGVTSLLGLMIDALLVCELVRLILCLDVYDLGCFYVLL